MGEAQRRKLAREDFDKTQALPAMIDYFWGAASEDWLKRTDDRALRARHAMADVLHK